jgi:DNA polymerase III subunit delta'
MHDFFLGIQGQRSALNILTEIHSNKRIPHALLFSGIEGIGKFYTAIQFIKLLNENSSNNAQKKIDQLSEPFVKVIMPLPRGKSESNNDLPTAKLSQDIIEDIQSQLKHKAENPYHKIELKNANNIKINSIREINKMVSLNYDEIRYRGIIISDAHKMSIEAQNAFLKNLEEPPEGIIYILLTNNPLALLTTIKSRCWEINFSPLEESELTSILQQKYILSQDKFNDVIPFAQGSVTNALFLIENDLKEYLRKTILILRYSLARKYHTALKEFNDIIRNNSVMPYQIVVDLIIAWFTDTLKQKYNIGKINFEVYNETLEKFNSRFTNTHVDTIVSKLVEYRNAPTRNVSLNLLAMNVIFEIASIGMKRK